MRLYSGRNPVPKFRGKLFEDEDLKRRKIGETGPKKAHHAPRAWKKLGMHLEHITIHLEHGFGWTHAPRALLMRPEHLKCEGADVISCFLVGKTHVISSYPV